MSDDARDPRTDPRPGDLLEMIYDDCSATVRVQAVTDYYVVFTSLGRMQTSDVTLKGWRRFFRNARVVARGAGAQGGGGA